MNERGFLLPTAVILLALIGLGVATVGVLLQADLRAIGKSRAALQAHYSAEAALLAASVALPPRVDPLAVEEGSWLPGAGEGVFFPGPPYGFRLSVHPGAWSVPSPRQIHVVARAQAIAGASRTLRGVLVRSRLPYSPAGLLVVQGEIHRASVLGGSGELADIAVSGDSTVPALAAGNPGAARQLEALGFSDPIRVARSIAIAQFLRDIDRVVESGSAWKLDSFGQQARYLPGGVIRGLQGEGLLVVSGDLRLEGRVDFAGVMLVEGTLELASDHCRIRGFVQIDAMKVHAACTFRMDLAAVLQADSLQKLPRQARLQAILPAHGP